MIHRVGPRLLTALLLAAPLAAQAQSPGQAGGTAQGSNPLREPNLANPQAQDNQQMQPPNAREGGGQAGAIPTPTLDRKMTPTDTGNAAPSR